MNVSSRLRTGAFAVVMTVATVHVQADPKVRTTAVSAAPRANGFELTVDSIMRGPKLVGYPPTGLRWSGDSARLYFEWRQPADDEASTWVVAREESEPRKLTDAERRSAPPPNGVWDAARRRVLFVDAGDIALVDSIAGTRRNITRTTADEANPRWVRHDTAVSFTRENNLYVVELSPSAPDGAVDVVAQLTDIAPKKHKPRET